MRVRGLRDNPDYRFFMDGFWISIGGPITARDIYTTVAAEIERM